MGGCFSLDDPIQPNNQIQNRPYGNQQINTQAQNNYQGQQMQQPQYGQYQNYGQQVQPQYGQNQNYGQQMQPQYGQYQNFGQQMQPQYGQNQNYGQQMQPQYGQNFGQGQQMRPPPHGQNQNYGQFQMQPQGARVGNQFAVGQTQGQNLGYHIFQRHFPPQFSSLCSDVKASSYKYDIKEEMDKYRDEKKYQWTRAGEIKELTDKEGPVLFLNQFSPMDVKQHQFGTCWVLASLAALAENDQRVRKLFNSVQPNPDGSYDVIFCCDGYRQRINVDDYLPTGEDNTIHKNIQLLSARSINGTIWHCLLEKAYAKYFGCYLNIWGGQPYDCLNDLTGHPSFYYETTIEDAWEKINEGNQKNYVMCAATKTDFTKAYQAKTGMCPNHAYTLLGTATVTDKNGQSCQLVQLRNPWGNFEWQGDWSDNSSCWTAQLKQQFNVQSKIDGLFWMAFKDFQEHFNYFHVCHYDDNLIFSSNTEPLRFQKKGDYKFIRMQIYNSGNYKFTCMLRSRKQSRREKQEQYWAIRFNVLKLQNGIDLEGDTENIKICASPIYMHAANAYSDPFEVQLDDLQVGVYLVLIDPDINESFTEDNPMWVNTYGPGNVALQDVTLEYIRNGYGLQDYLANIYSSLFNQNEDEFSEATISEDVEVPETIKLWELDTFNGYRVYILQNSDEQITITQKIKWNIIEGNILPAIKDEKDLFKLNGVNMEIIAKPQNWSFIFIRVNLCDEDLSYGMDETTCVLS